MKSTISIIFILCILGVNSQSIQRLDSNNGFKHFKFETSPSLYSELENIYPTHKLTNFSEYYFRVKNDELMLGDFKIYGIRLIFYKDKLKCIRVSLDEYSLQQTYKLLVQAFGTPNNVEFHEHYSSESPVVRAGAGWIGKKVSLGFRYIQSDVSSSPDNGLTFSTLDYETLLNTEKNKSEQEKLKKAVDDF